MKLYTLKTEAGDERLPFGELIERLSVADQDDIFDRMRESISFSVGLADGRKATVTLQERLRPIPMSEERAFQKRVVAEQLEGLWHATAVASMPILITIRIVAASAEEACGTVSNALESGSFPWHEFQSEFDDGIMNAIDNELVFEEADVREPIEEIGDKESFGEVIELRGYAYKEETAA